MVIPLKFFLSAVYLLSILCSLGPNHTIAKHYTLWPVIRQLLQWDDLNGMLIYKIP